MRIEDFDYQLPADLIAQFPAAQRGASRMLHLDARSGGMEDLAFSALVERVGAGDVVVFNDTRVIKARLFASKRTGGHVELLIERVLDEHRALALVRASKPVRDGTVLRLDGGPEVTVTGREGSFHQVRFEADGDVLTVLDRHGHVPLPPYIERSPDERDGARYQTVYARRPGAVAAPTAGLHFDEAMMSALAARGVELAYVTLHVGAGTFRPVRVQRVEEHEMHSEWFSVPEATAAAIRRARAQGRRVLAVGTTSLRALEAAAADGEPVAGSNETNLYILPGYRFRVVDRLLTNFHLPRSTLLMLVSAFGGTDRIKAAYRHAVEQRYRFFSYGDAMLIERAQEDEP